MASILYQGHGSFRLTLQSGAVFYIDPFAGEGYDRPADVILVTHQHHDHNCVDFPARKETCVVYQNTDALQNGVYRTVTLCGAKVEAVEAYNRNHDRASCVGYLIEADGLLLYFAGDTSTTDQMASLASRGIDYAFLPADGVYNMDIPEAIACAERIKAKHTVPCHIAPGKLYDEERAKQFVTPSVLYIRPGVEQTL